jgi:signal transduction histidine kinase
VREDKLLQRERAGADDDLRTERAERAAGMAAERAETDKDLSNERARSDHALATRDEFLGLVSHDLRNMLGSVMGFSTTLERPLASQRPRRVRTG